MADRAATSAGAAGPDAPAGRRRCLAKYLGALLLFGSNGIVASQIALSSIEIVYLRTFVGALLLAAVFAASRRPAAFLRQRREALFLALSGASLGASWMFLFEAYQLVGVGISSLAYYCGPVIVMAVSPLLLRERPTRAGLAGFAAVLAGIVLVSGTAVQGGASLPGLACGGMSAVFYACMVVFSKKAPSITGLENPMVQLAAAFAVVALVVAVRQGPVVAVAPSDVLPVLFLGAVNTGLGCYLYFSSLGRLPVQTVSVCGYLEPVSAVVLSAVLLGEQMTLVQVAGAALVIGGAAAGELLSGRAAPQRRGQVLRLTR